MNSTNPQLRLPSLVRSETALTSPNIDMISWSLASLTESGTAPTHTAVSLALTMSSASPIESDADCGRAPAAEDGRPSPKMLSGVLGRERLGLGRPKEDEGRSPKLTAIGCERAAASPIVAASSPRLIERRTMRRSSFFSWRRSASFSRTFMYSVAWLGAKEDPGVLRCAFR